MNAVKITSTQPTSVTPTDPSSTTSDSGSDFGPILHAATVSPAAAPAQGPSRSSARSQQDSTTTKDDGSAAKAAQDPTSSTPPDRTARRSGRDRAGSVQPQADLAAAACAAALAAPAGAESTAAPDASATPVSATADASAVATDASVAASDPTRAVTATVKAGAVALADATAPAQPAIAISERSTLQSPANANSPTPIDAHRAVTAQPARGQSTAKPLDRSSVSMTQAAAAAPVQSTDAQSAADDSSDDTGADPQADPGLAALVPAPVAAFGTAAQTAAHALPVQIQQASLHAADSAPAHSSSALLLPSDPTSNPANTAAGSSTGAFGNVTAYPAEGRTAVATPVGQPGFGQELSERVVVLARGGIQTAQISLEPAGLGPVGVSIQVHGHAASLVFTAQHETTRNALEAELPRLREMFAASGMQLSDASVGGRAQPQWSGPNPSLASGQSRTEGGADPVAAGLAEPDSAARPLAVRRLVDTYA